MSILKFLYPKKSVKRKILDIKDEMKNIVKSVSSEKIWIFWYGAYDIDPKHLVFWVCVDTDSERRKLNENEDLKQKLRDLLVKYEYPKTAREKVVIGFESQETVDRVSNGNWYFHFK